MKQLIQALLAFQIDCPKITKDSNNPFFKSKYADLTSIWETIQPILARHELVIVQPVVGFEVKTIVYHTSGECIESTFPIVSKDQTNPQSFLAAVTYARRGALQSILSIVAEDDDGNTAAKIDSELAKIPKADKNYGQPKSGMGF